MSFLDIMFATCAGLAAFVLIAKSRWHRAVFVECLLHPRSEGWVDMEADQVKVHRGLSLSDHVLSQTLESLREAQAALEAASEEIKTRGETRTSQSLQNAESSNWWPYAAMAASIAAVAAGATAFLGGKSSSKGGA
jgi:hypothetical protein